MKRREFLNRSAILGASLVMSNSLLASACCLFQNSHSRSVIQVLNPRKTKVGSLPIIRAFPGRKKDYISPFLVFDEFGPVNLETGQEPLGVSAHPHAGVIPTTYFLSGAGHHKDSLSYDLQVGQGEFMMFQSGRGAIHMEETGQKLYDAGGEYHGFQIWLNLPAKDKFIDPNTFIHKAPQLPEIQKENYSIKIILGEYDGQKSSAETLTPAFYYHIKIKKEAKLTMQVDPEHNAFIYLIKGELELADNVTLKKSNLALYERDKTDIEIVANEAAELLLLGGEVLNGSVVSYGPFVMNTEEQIDQCFRDYKAGKMGNPKLVR